MRETSWIAGILWDILEFARKEGHTVVELALLEAIRKTESETGPDPRGRELRRLEKPGTPSACGYPPAVGNTRELSRGKPRYEQ